MQVLGTLTPDKCKAPTAPVPISWCPETDSNRHAISERFSYYYSFRYLLRVCSLDYPFTIAYALGVRRLVSTPS